MKTFEQLCEEYNNVKVLKRGGQKKVFSAINNNMGKCVIKRNYSGHP